MSTRHRWADVITAWANGEAIQFRNAHDDEWYDWSHHGWRSTPHFEARDTEWRIKPRMCSLNGHEFPAPETKPPERDALCWCPCPTIGDCVTPISWLVYESDMILLRRGRIHLSRDAAIAHARAEILAVGGTLEDES